MWWQERIKKLPEDVQRTFPFLIVPKTSKRERNMGLDGQDYKSKRPSGVLYNTEEPDGFKDSLKRNSKNIHPTCKPIKLMSYLIVLGSRENDIILDPFAGSGTTLIAAKKTGRKYLGFEISPEYCEIARKRINSIPNHTF